MKLIDQLIDKMQASVEAREQVSPDRWLDRAQQLNVLLQDEQDELYTLEAELAKEKAKLFDDPDMKVNRANLIMEARPKYLEARKLHGKIKRVEELIRIAKKQATLSSNNYMNQ